MVERCDEILPQPRCASRGVFLRRATPHAFHGACAVHSGENGKFGLHGGSALQREPSGNPCPTNGMRIEAAH